MVHTEDLRQRLLLDRLKLYDDKTEYLLIGTRQKLDKLCGVLLAVGDHGGQESKNVGCWFDQQLSMVVNINKICSASYFF